jgi:hypothetical protein
MSRQRPKPAKTPTVRSTRLHDHLLHDHLLHEHLLHEHGRDAREIDGLPLADLHHFEHVEQALGLNDLGHQHSDDVATRPLRSAETHAAPITEVLADAGDYPPPSRAWSLSA